MPEAGWLRAWQLFSLNPIFSLKSNAKSQGSETFWAVETRQVQSKSHVCGCCVILGRQIIFRV